MDISDLEVLDAIRFTEGVNSCNYSGGCGNDSDIRSYNDLASGNMITFIPTLLGLNSAEEKAIQWMCMNSVGKGWLIEQNHT